MAQYETVCVVKPDVQGERLDKISDKIKKVLGDFKVTNLNRQDWGIRKLSYTIQNFKTAHYLQFTYEGGGGLVSEIERQLNYDDSILRYMTMKLTKGSRPDVKPEPFQFAKVEAESYSHPFGGGYDRRERFGRGGDRRDFRDSRGDSRDQPRDNREPAKEPAKEER